jgi:Mitochondrial carrier protein
MLRNVSIGIAASIVSDSVVNAIRVIKTTKQSLGSKNSATYSETVTIILAADGWKGLFGRGLRTRILGNALQSILFTLIWRGLADRWSRKEEHIETKDDAVE